MQQIKRCSKNLKKPNAS